MSECRCGANFRENTWLLLPLVGVMDNGDGGTLELRNCACGSTLAVALPVARVA